MPLCVANLRGHIHKSVTGSIHGGPDRPVEQGYNNKKKTYKVRVCYKQTFRFTVISHYHR